MSPRLKPSRSFGAMLATYATEAETVPSVAPSAARRMRTCHGACANDESAERMQPLNIARTTIGLRPYRSEITPQIGAAIVIVSAPIALSTPDQSVRARI